MGVWNASTNSPTLTSGSGTVGEYYIVSVAGSTNLDGITDWKVGDWAVFSDQATDAWQKIDNTQVGNVTGSGSNGRVAFWNSDSNITSDTGLTYNSSTDILTASGGVLWSGGGSAESNDAYDNTITGFSDSGSSTITLTLTQRDGGTLTTSFSNPQGTMSSFVINTATGLDGAATVTNGSTVNLSLDLDELASGGTLVGADSLIAVNGGVQNKQTISSIPLSIFNNNSGFTSFAEPGIFSGGGTPTLATGVTGAEIRALIGAGTSSTTGTVTGTGVDNRLALWNGTTAIDSNANLSISGNDLNIGTQAGTTAARLLLYGTTANNGASIIKTTNGNLHIDSDDNHTVYINYYTGTDTGSSLVIGNGASGSSGTFFQATGDATIGDELTITTIANATSDTDKFLVSDSGVVKYRTGAQVLSDIGGAPATGGAYLPLTGGTMTTTAKNIFLQHKSIYSRKQQQ